MSIADDLLRAASARPDSRAEKRRRQIIAAVARWKARNPEKVAAQRKRWRERQAAR